MTPTDPALVDQYDQGFRAYYAKRANPYPIGSSRASEWDRGNLDAAWEEEVHAVEYD